MEWFVFPVILLFIFGPWRRRRGWGSWGRWDRGRPERDRDLDSGEHQAPNRQRDAQIDLLETRVAELESRLDYAERLLTQHREAQRLPSETEPKG